MEKIVRNMQHEENGVPVRSQKAFLTSIPCAFMGYDVIEWLMEKLGIEESAEAVHLANLLCQFGYFFPVSETKNINIKDDGSFYRFQAPYFWPSATHSPDNIEYAIYLVKRSLRNKQKHGLEDYETETFNQLRKVLSHKWDFICLQAEEQVKLAKERKKADKIVMDSQERAYWRVHRPPPGYPTPLDTAPVPLQRNGMKKKGTKKDLQNEIEKLKETLNRARLKTSQAIESIFHHCDMFTEYDPFITGSQPSNPWVTEDNAYWVINGVLVDAPTEKRVRRWGLSLHQLLQDPTGLQEFENYLKTEYSSENIRFWKAVEDLRLGSQSSIENKVNNIYEEFLSHGASCEVNLDSKTFEMTQNAMKKPNRYTFDAAQKHVFALMNKDSYARFLRSDTYKHLLANAVQPSHKKKFFSFGGVVRKKNSTPNANNHFQIPCNSKRRGSSNERNLSGSTNDLHDRSTEGKISSVLASFMGHSLSTSNLHDLESTENSYRENLTNTGKKRSTWSNLLSSPTSQEKLNEISKGGLEVPKPKSAEVSLLETSLSLGLGLSLVVPASKKPSNKGRRLSDDPLANRPKNEVCPWEPVNEEPKRPQNSPQDDSSRKKHNEVCPWEDEEAK